MNPQSTPEFYGYTIGQNVGPFIQKCIEATSECYLSEGTHILGRNDSNWSQGNVYSDSIITWGWGKVKTGVKVIGAGVDKTTIKFVDNVQSRRLFNADSDYVFMVQSKYDESCDDVQFLDFTLDGNYQNNKSTSTINGIRIRGKRGQYRVAFKNFGVGGNQKGECFELCCGPIDNNDEGPEVSFCRFSDPGQKTGSPAGYVPEHSFIAVWGKNPKVTDNKFTNCKFDVKTQQSPLHAITLSGSSGALVARNSFDDFGGCILYSDSWTNTDVTFTENTGKVWQIAQFSCQSWGGDAQISFNKNVRMFKNSIELSSDPTYYEWDRPAGVSSIVGYVYAPEIDQSKHKGFENIVFENNDVVLGKYVDASGNVRYSDKLICYYGSTVGEDRIKLGVNNLMTTKPAVFPIPVVVPVQPTPIITPVPISIPAVSPVIQPILAATVDVASIAELQKAVQAFNDALNKFTSGIKTSVTTK